MKQRTGGSVGLYRRVFAFARPYLHLFALSILLSFLIVGFEAVYLWVPASLVRVLFDPQEMVSGQTAAMNIDSINAVLKNWTYRLVRTSDPFATLKMICVVLVLACLVKNICVYLQELVVGRLNLNIVRDFRNAFYRHVMMLPVSFYDRNKSGTIISKTLNDVSEVNIAITQSFNRLLIEPLRLVTYLGLLVVINWQMTLIVFVLYPVLGYGIIKIGQSVRRRSKRMLHDLSGLVSVLNETVSGLRVVKMFNMNRIESAKFESENEKYVRSAFRSVRMRALSRPLTETLGAVVAGVLLWFGGRQVLDPNNPFTAEDFFRFLFLLLNSYRPLKALSQVNVALQGGMAAGERLFETMDEPPELLKPFEDRNVPVFEQDIRLKHVTFRYEGYDETVLEDISVDIRKGMVVALVGPSGSGKSTILDCIPRFYEISEGAILLDGRDVREFDLVGYRHLFGIVAQDTVLFNDTVYNNIAYGMTRTTPEAVETVARGANAWEFIEKLPDKLNTVVGERGVTLSGGQRQRIAIARALLRNPPILILDEATSALDTEAERLVQKAINRLMENRTTIMVAHRLSTVQHADLIVVLDQGRVVETGTHQSLMAQTGRYRKLYEMQHSGW